MVEETSAELGIERRPIEDDEVLKRCLYPLINEGARILEDGIAIRPCDIDIVYSMAMASQSLVARCFGQIRSV